jgi:hypothetical protein
VNRAEMLRYVRTIRALSTEEAAVQLLEAFDRAVRNEEDEAALTAELDGFEQLPDHGWDSLMAWAMQAPEPRAFADRLGAGDLVTLRQARLLGDLARAAEQSVTTDAATTRRLAMCLGQAWERVRGEAILSLALEFEGASDVEGPVA